MDIMKTLLIYMSATLGLAVQSTAAPKVTPVPTPEPGEAAIVETADTGETPAPGTVETIDVQMTAVPPEEAGKAPEITPAPVPTITPNMKGYHNLGMGAKGKDVRKLQEKLIEMGYLPEGAADGAYGRQTYNAVKKFQYYNGLKQDGVAGRATQTNLFENPDAPPNPEAVTPAPAEEATPEPPEAAGAAPEAAAEAAPAEAEPEPAESAEPEAEASPETEEPAEPETEETPEPEESAEPENEETPEPEASAEPEAAGDPEATEAPEVVMTSAPEEEPQEIVENVDLDAELYEPVTGAVALNEGDGPLEFIVTQDGVPVNSRPRLMQNGSKIRVSLDDLCSAVEGWRITDDGVGTVVLEAAGYTLAIYNEDQGLSATVDGTEVAIKPGDFDFSEDGHFISADFLAAALKGEASWDQEESTLMLRIRDKLNPDADG